MKLKTGILLISASLLFSCSSIKPVDADAIHKSSQRVGVSVHDPSVIRADGKYYIFGSHMEAAVSDDLISWKRFATGVSRTNRLFDNLFTGLEAFDYVGRNTQGGYSVWAPDVIYNRMTGQYMMYFCTTSSYIKSNICFALSDSVEGPYSYEDTILYSGFTRGSIDMTDVKEIAGDGNLEKYIEYGSYKNTLWPNAIDPALFYDEVGRLWMVYGSWSGGIFILEIDEETGRPIHPPSNEEDGVDSYFGKHLAGGWHNSVEGPYIIYDELSGYYYLFLSYGALTSNGGYQIRLFRSESPDGPYTDKRGETLDRGKLEHSEYGVKLMGNYLFPSLEKAYMAPGHNSALLDSRNHIYLVHHTRFDDGSEYHEPRVRRLFRTSDGWLTAAPFPFTGTEKTATGLTRREVAGSYFMVNHGTDISSNIKKAEETFFCFGGAVRNVEGTRLGSWHYDGDRASVSIKLEEDLFAGVLFKQTDEAGNEVMAFSALSENTGALWGVKYQ